MTERVRGDDTAEDAIPVVRRPRRTPVAPGSSLPVARRPVGVLVGVGVALAAVIVGLVLVVTGVLRGEGPRILARGPFPGSVEFVLTTPVDRLVVYLEQQSLGADLTLPAYVGPVATRDGVDVPVTEGRGESRHDGVSTRLVPIGVVTGTPGSYRVAVDPSGEPGSGNKIAIGDPSDSAGGLSRVVLGVIVGLGGGLVGIAAAVVAGIRTRRKRPAAVFHPPVGRGTDSP